MKGINIWFAETFEEKTKNVSAGIKEPDGRQIWVKSRPVGAFNLSHRLWCILKVWRGEADIITFYKQ